MPAMQRPQIVGQVNTALQSGKLNDAFQAAVTCIPFHLEDPDFMKIMGQSLACLGFPDESKSVLDYVNELQQHRLNHKGENPIKIRENNTIDHAHEYKKEGIQTNWNNPFWVKRSKIISKMMHNADKLLDFGCGNMLIERFLDSKTEYIPCDIEKRDERTIVCNFDELQYPEDQSETHILCLGVLNYLKHQKELVTHICNRLKPFYLSFKPKDLIQKKIDQGVFADSLSFQEICSIISDNGHTVSYRYLLGQGEEVLINGTPKTT